METKSDHHFLNGRITATKGDITNIAVDAIVNAANSSLMGGGGVDGAIHRAGGPAILEACRKIVASEGGCKPGQAVITTAGSLPAKFVIHTVGPIWKGGNSGEEKTLAACYVNCLKLAEKHGCKSVAFPNISTGVYGFPKEKAATIAVGEAVNILRSSSIPAEVIFVCFDDENFHLTVRALEASA
jgi:O-acetyl-ADP-ribose deacetylase (regulator of RNase III)